MPVTMIDDNRFRTQRPHADKIQMVNLPEPKVYHLSNGIPVFFIRSGEQELVKIDFNFDAGSYFEPQPLVAHFTNKCMREGTSSFNSKQIAESLDFYGAYLKVFTSRDDAQLTLFCLDKHLDNILPILHEVIFRPVFPEDEVETIVKKSLQQHLVNLKKVSFLSRQIFPSVIYGKTHPYGKYAKPDDYADIPRQLLQDFYETSYKSSSFRIIISGNPVSDPIEKLNRFFGRHKIEKSKTLKYSAEILPKSQREHFVKSEGTLQSAVRIGHAIFNKKHPDFLKLQVVNTILGGYFGSRLMKNIREDKGFTYGIGSALVSFQHGGMFFIASELGNAVTGQAITEIYKEIEKLRASYVEDEELELVKNYILGNLLRSADGPFALSELLKAVLDYDLDMGFYNEFIRIVKEISREEVLNIARLHLDPNSMYQLVVGDDLST